MCKIIPRTWQVICVCVACLSAQHACTVLSYTLFSWNCDCLDSSRCLRARGCRLLHMHEHAMPPQMLLGVPAAVSSAVRLKSLAKHAQSSGFVVVAASFCVRTQCESLRVYECNANTRKNMRHTTHASRRVALHTLVTHRWMAAAADEVTKCSGSISANRKRRVRVVRNFLLAVLRRRL